MALSTSAVCSVESLVFRLRTLVSFSAWTLVCVVVNTRLVGPSLITLRVVKSPLRSLTVTS